MSIPKKSWNLSLDSLSDTMTNGVGILILMLLSVTAVSPPNRNSQHSITWEMMRQAQARCADLESHQSQLCQQWEKLKADKEQKQAELERLQAQLKELQQFTDISPNTLDECSSLGINALKTLLQAAASKQEQVVKMQQALTDMCGRLDAAEKTLQDKHNSIVLENMIRTLIAEIEQLERQRQELANKINDDDIECAKLQELRKKLDDIQAEIERLKVAIAKLEEKPPSKSGRYFGGDYHGPFILLECDDKGVVVYPGSKRIPLESPAEETDWLKGEIRRVGAALLVVRPSGFKESYAKFYELITKFVDGEASQGKKIVLSFWPIEAEESVKQYLPEDF
jgi:predicted  nucleic acid-binding Zn-ribbon protein